MLEGSLVAMLYNSINAFFVNNRLNLIDKSFQTCIVPWPIHLVFGRSHSDYLVDSVNVIRRRYSAGHMTSAPHIERVAHA